MKVSDSKSDLFANISALVIIHIALKITED